MADEVRVVFHDGGLADLLRSPVLGDLLVEAAGPGVREAKARAPKRTGAGAAGIRAEKVRDAGEWTARASWDRDQFYMGFHETGTEHEPARPFLVPSFEGAR